MISEALEPIFHTTYHPACERRLSLLLSRLIYTSKMSTNSTPGFRVIQAKYTGKFNPGRTYSRLEDDERMSPAPVDLRSLDLDAIEAQLIVVEAELANTNAKVANIPGLVGVANASREIQGDLKTVKELRAFKAQNPGLRIIVGAPKE